MKQGRDLADALIAATILVLGASYLTQCSPATQPPSPAVNAEAAHGREGASGAEAEREKAAGKPKSVRELDEEQTNEEREKIQRIGRALKTIGANPELRKTYGIPQ